ncbi:hypothetical protein [Vibrio superstes]|uniref:Prenylated flavin chaperone LpdD-like domain-containing protein n=1 Tax=Vibrio superstes NBRC 103154 TaxID=1219062 RepID=A0A511QNH6_9VIBR|nr:hypothetical protein [Vibrio superstes]GEM78870.1 hypothetical protein VSU01S_11150 [Vibrio superstes NBRC 103154]
MKYELTTIRDTKITLSVCVAGDDLSLTLYGGEKGHIGAVTLGYAHNGKVNYETLSVPEHKEHFLTRNLIEYVVPQYAKTCVISCGIHWDNITQDEIEQSVQDSIKLVSRYLNDLENTLQ